MRSEQKLLNIQFEAQDSPDGAAVNITTASIASADQLNPPDELVVGVQNQIGAILSESDVIAGAGTKSQPVD